MEKTFESILEELLQARDNNPNADLNELFENKAKELGVENCENIMNIIKETGDLLKEFCEAAADLQEAKNQGTSRGEWLAESMAKATEKCDNDVKEAIFASIAKGMAISSGLVTEEELNAKQITE